MEIILVLSLAIAATSVTVTKMEIFAPLRTWADTKSHWLSKLLACHYCVSHWLALIAVAIWRPRLLHSGPMLLDLAVSMMVIVFFAGILAALLWAVLTYKHRIARK